MNEVRRQASLSALGIETWYARGPLPGAAPSPVFEWAQGEEPVPEPLPLQAPQHLATARDAAPEPARDDRSPRPSLAAVRASLAGEGPVVSSAEALPASTAAAAAPAAPVEDVAPPTDAPAKPVDDALSVPPSESRLPPGNTGNTGTAEEAGSAEVAIAGDEAVSVVAPASHELRLEGTFLSGRSLNLALDISQELSEAGQLKLAGNILRALGDEPVGQPQALCWPVFANAAVPGNDDEGLLRVVRSLLQEQPAKPWLVLGPQMLALFEALDGEPSQSFRLWLGNSASLQKLAANPQSKKQLWQQLQEQLQAIPLTPGGA
ncbi:MAG: hypothetical protein EA349_08515 [Halomonadaceae bacterium]|nr:MAG: hypothetical protein EA349_08515 [Halomonadaceae bacterium]